MVRTVFACTWVAAITVAVLACAATPARADTISEVVDEGVAAGVQFLGQGVHTPSGGPWTNIRFAWDSEVGAGFTAVAIGDLYILTTPYFGTPSDLSSSTAGFVAQSTGITDGFWTFDSSVVLQPGTTYYFVMGDRENPEVVNVVARFNDDLPGLFFSTASNVAYAVPNGGTNDINYRLTGVVPEPGTLALLGLGLVGLVLHRRRRIKANAT